MFVNLLTVMVVLAGIMSLNRLNLDTFPNVSLDIVTVTTRYQGATPKEIEKLITIPIEKELKEVEDVKEITSVSIESVSMIVLEIEPDASDKDGVVTDIQRAVDKAQDLPADLENDPWVEEVESKNRPVVEVSISGDLPEAELIDNARRMETLLLDMPEIAKVRRSGWRDEEIWVEVDPEKVDSYHLSLAEIISALRKRNISTPGGTVIDGSQEFLVRTNGEFYEIDEIEDVVLRANELGHWVQVKDVARVSEDFKPFTTIHRTDGQRAINLIAVKKERADVIETVNGIRDLVSSFRETASEGLSVSLVNDSSYYVKRRLNVLVNNGWIGILLVVTCLFLFLSPRTAIATAVGIPIAFLVTFTVMYFAGLTINLVTMFGLIMVLGMVVDDAIIMAENVHRLIDDGVPPLRAAVEGASAIWKPVVTSVLTTMAAFAPLMFMGGILGKFVMYIPLVVIIALFASLIQAFLVLPSHLVTIESLPRFKVGIGINLSGFNAWFKRLTESYVGLLERLIDHHWKVIGAFLIFLIISGAVGVLAIPTVIFPQRGIEAFYVRAKAPIGTPVEETERLLLPLEEIIATLPESEMDNFITQVGIQQNDNMDPTSSRASHLAQILVILKPTSEREFSSNELMADLREKSKGIGGLTEILFENMRSGPPVGKAVDIRVRGDDLEEMDGIADEIKEYLATIPGVSDIRDNYEEGKGEIKVEVDENRASQASLSIRDVALAIRSAFEGTIATTIKESDEEVDVRVRFPDEWRYREGALEKVLIPNGRGDLVPVTEVATFKKSPGLNAITHYDRKRAVTINAVVDEKDATSMSVTRSVMKKFADISKKYPGVSIIYAGEWEKTHESFDDLKMAMVIALLVIFMILAFEFQSLLQPMIVLFAVPYGFVGIIWAFLIHVEPMSFLAMMGAVGLAGVVVNNSIVFVDFINKSKDKELRSSILAAASLRFRPITLTTTTTVLGLLPVAYGIMGSDPFLKPMALAIGWGLAFATICTLLITPCLYAVVYDLHAKVSARFPFLKG